MKGLFPPIAILVVVGAAIYGLNVAWGPGGAQSSEKSHVASVESSTVDAKVAKPKLLFFMNPNGRPCQIQDEALSGVRAEIEPIADIVSIMTTNPNDEELFYRYGVRSLPTLVILNSDGREFKRFPPGIQSAKDIVNAIKEVR